jgi:hypothetical protein
MLGGVFKEFGALNTCLNAALRRIQLFQKCLVTVLVAPSTRNESGSSCLKLPCDKDIEMQKVKVCVVCER